MEISALSKEYLYIPITGVDFHGNVVDPTTLPAEVAFTTGAASPSSWVAGTWVTTTAGENLLRILVGPGTSFVLSAGTYKAWIRLTDVIEVPVFAAGTLTVT